jgi:glutamate N-acetyltransferase/amino-acid N-acetyltransferase
MITTDLGIESRLLTRSLQQSVARSFSRLTLDGDSSPNDTIMVLANGMAEGPPITEASSWEYGAWQEALDALTADLAQQVVRDAAGSGKIIQVTVRGAQNEANARQMAQTIARSHAVRAACDEGRPDWGTVLAAVGASGAEMRSELLDIYVGDLLLMFEGLPVSFDQNIALQIFSGQEIEFTIDLHLGPSSATMWTCTWHGEHG